MVSQMFFSILAVSVALIVGWLAGIPFNDQRGVIGWFWASVTALACIALALGH